DPGKKLDYQVVVKSKKGGVKVSLASGPEGMHVTPEGKVTWSVPRDQHGDVDVILSIGDSSGQEVFQTFRLAFGEARAAGAGKTAGAGTPKSKAPAMPPPSAGSTGGFGTGLGKLFGSGSPKPAPAPVDPAAAPVPAASPPSAAPAAGTTSP